jgi:hypothetical protein
MDQSRWYTLRVVGDFADVAKVCLTLHGRLSDTLHPTFDITHLVDHVETRRIDLEFAGPLVDHDDGLLPEGHDPSFGLLDDEELIAHDPSSLDVDPVLVAGPVPHREVGALTHRWVAAAQGMSLVEVLDALKRLLLLRTFEVIDEVKLGQVTNDCVSRGYLPGRAVTRP